MRPGGAPSTKAGQIESLQSLPSSVPAEAPTPISLSSQQIDCVNKFFPGGMQAFLRYGPDQQARIVAGYQIDCVDKELGIQPPPRPPIDDSVSNSRVSGLRPTPVATQVAGAGVISEGAGNPPAHVGPSDVQRFTNRWTEMTPTGGLVAWAGYADVHNLQTGAHDVSQGVVVVTGSGEPPAAYPTPSKHGPIRVVDSVGETLELKAQDGTMLYFDVANRTFVPSLPAASLTPPQGRGTRGGPAATP